MTARVLATKQITKGQGVMKEFSYLAPCLARKPVVLPITATAARFAIPSAWRGRVVELMSDGADADYLFGPSTVACVYGQASGVAAEVITPHAASGGHLVSKVGVLVRVPGKDDPSTHLSVDCVAAGTANLYIQIVD